MAGVLGRESGGIRGLRELVDDYPEAIQYELLRLGLRLEHLGTHDLSWFDLKAVLVSLPPGSALHRAQDEDDATWDIHAQLQAATIDALNLANWQRSGDKNASKPSPIRQPRPTVEPLTAEKRAALNRLLPEAFSRGG